MALIAGKILKISISLDSRKKILEYVQKYLQDAKVLRQKDRKNHQNPLVIVTPNPEQIVYAQNDSHFADILNWADISLPDGIGLVWAYQILDSQKKDSPISKHIQRIPGVEFVQDLVDLAAERGYRIGLIGGRANLAVKAFECLQRQRPKLRGWAQDGPHIPPIIVGKSPALFPGDSEYIETLAAKIRSTDTRIVFVGLGAPKQEYVIERLAAELTGTSVVLMAVGGSFAIIAGALRRAPQALRLLGLEWLWRLMQEPRRWRRQLALLRFVLLVLKKRNN